MFAELYHAHHALHPEDLPFWTDLAAQHTGPILELGCGTGRVLVPLAQSRAANSQPGPIIGLERDAEMLQVLRRHLPDTHVNQIRLIQADFTQFCLTLAFGLIVMPCNTYSTLTEAQRQQVLERVSAHLRPGGVFAAGLPNPALLRDLPARSAPQVEEAFPHPLDGEPVQVSSGWRRTRSAFTLTWYYDHLLPDGAVERLSAQVQHSLAPAQTYLDELKAAGFSQIRLLGDYDGTDFNPDAPNMIFVATG